MNLGQNVCLSDISDEFESVLKTRSLGQINPLPYMPILGSSNSAANKDMMSKIWTNWVAII